MKKYNKLLIIVILLSFSIINCTDKVQAYKGNKTANSNTYIQDVKKVIENYFIDLESCYDANKFEDMQFEKYFFEYEKNTNCNLNSLYLYSNIEIQKNCGEDLEEKNKKIKFTFGEYKLLNLKETSMNVIIEKNWNYAESPTIDSGSVDKYNVIMDVANRDKPKIKRI